jgi:hypothetical protein
MTTTTLPTALRRLVLLGAPLAIGVLNLTHPGPDPANPSATMFESLLAQGLVDWMIALHFIQTALVGFLGLALWTLADGLRGPAVTLSRVGVWAFVITYAAFDAVAGIATGTFVRYGSMLPMEQQPAMASVLEAFSGDPIVGGATFSLLGGAASIAWLLASVPLAVAMGRAGASRVAVTLLILGAIVFGVSHPAPFGPAGMALFLAGTAVFEFGGSARRLATRGQTPPLASTSAAG